MHGNDRRLAGSTILARSDDDLLTAEVDGELMGMSVERGTCYGFNGVGTRIWHLLAEPRSIDSLCAALVSEYEVEDDVCRQDVVTVVQRLCDEGLVEVDQA